MANSFKNFLCYTLPLILYCGMIFYSSSVQSPLPKSESIPYLDKVVHALAYAPLGILFFRFFRFFRFEDRIRLSIILSILAASLYGASDEIHQYFVPSRVCDIADWISDSVGGAIGTLIYYRLIPSLTKYRLFYRR